MTRAIRREKRRGRCPVELSEDAGAVAAGQDTSRNELQRESAWPDAGGEGFDGVEAELLVELDRGVVVGSYRER